MLRALERNGLALAAAVTLLLGVGTAAVVFAAPLLDPGLREPGHRPREVTDIAALGEQVYIREGCQNCHSQLVRPVPADAELGPVTEAGDPLYQSPHLFGVARIGPDLSCAADRFPADGTADLIRSYLTDPGGPTSGSKMPSYAYLSETDRDALTAYLLTRTCGLARPDPEPSPQPGASPTAQPDPLEQCQDAGEPGTGDVTLEISAANVQFNTDRLEGAEDCQPFTIAFTNDESVPHNVSLYTDETLSQEIFLGEVFGGPDSRDYAIPALPAGEYYFQCDVHPAMNGTLVVGG